MGTEQDKCIEKSIDVNDVEQNLERVLKESKGAPIAVLKDCSPLYYCVPADTYAAMLEAIEVSEMEKLRARIHQLGLEVFGDEETFKSWMKKPAIALEGKSPELMMATKEGIQQVSDLLGKIDHGFIF
ncbi:MbcA/ParS/Xre antitoxin family protein [Marinomonas sp. 15G1-11]|uniref:MbcA/ParS/Xre antitoxin family protein n=1 Tax=Marinomonas phaeophyticola TaxID=3004091 RepID=A0ABT4JVE9_9GAMM|nr:MbcA/ParS/Xre antitoxin family protein [Marinomonas sp. 15G1-11]MCZ2722363.1 MbcA/ParS/Xre antitoxin family protein [Marinomonas sp. 15G1-11]